MNLTQENYFSLEADRNFMSVSQYKSFCEKYGGCEAKAVAKLENRWVEKPSTPLLVGSYVHSNFEGTLGTFKAEHPEIFTQKGTLKAEYQLANAMINCLETDDSFKQIYQGDREKIYTFDLFGTQWKMKADLVNENEGYIIDLKTTKDFDRQWVERDHKNVKVSFVEAYGYILQQAVYKYGIQKALNRDDIEFFIIAVTKQDPPDKIILNFTEEDFKNGLQEIEDNIQHVVDVKNHVIEPKGCGKCDYCRSIKTLSKTTHWSEL